MRKNIRWTPAEWDEVVSTGARLYLTGAVDGETKAFQQANEMMPPERRRVFTSENKLYPSMYKDWAERWKSAVEAMRKTLAHEKEEAQAAQQQQENAAAQAVQQPAPVAEHIAASAATLLTQALMSAFLDALETPRGQAALRKAFEVPAGVVDESFKVPGLTGNHPVVKRKRVVLVVGLLGSQVEEVKRDFGEKLELRFLAAEDGTKRARENAKGADVTFGMVSYMGHPLDKALNSSAKDYRRVNGTVSELERLIYNLTISK